jgi:methylthioribose-1-phosphate isomerase
MSAATTSASASAYKSKHPAAVEWIGGADGFLRLIDQTRLPTELVHVDCRTAAQVWEAIKTLRVRGAPAIGVAAAYGVVVAVAASPDTTSEAATKACDYLATSRPTAVNLFWALDRMRRVATRVHKTTRPFIEILLDEARAIHTEDAEMCAAMGRHGAALFADGDGVLTHCNTGALATGGAGTALAAIYEAAAQGKALRVYADETRPLLQGARLTAWELMQAGIDVTLICDNMAAQVMREGRVRHVIVGADRIAANGDTANKIGTYGVALLAAAHNIPFYVAAPSSTFDLSIPDGSKIPIEQRGEPEITEGFGRRTAPAGVKVYNPAFDVTPARLIAGIVTEKGLIRPVNEASIRSVLKPRAS